MGDMSGEMRRLSGSKEISKGSAEWTAAQIEANLAWGLLLSPCHQSMAVEVGVWYADGPEWIRIGSSWGCFAAIKQHGTGDMLCVNPVANGGKYFKAYRSVVPKDFSGQTWESVKASGARHGHMGWGYYCVRENGMIFPVEKQKISYKPLMPKVSDDFGTDDF